MGLEGRERARKWKGRGKGGGEEKWERKGKGWEEREEGGKRERNIKPPEQKFWLRPWFLSV